MDWKHSTFMVAGLMRSCDDISRLYMYISNGPDTFLLYSLEDRYFVCLIGITFALLKVCTFCQCNMYLIQKQPNVKKDVKSKVAAKK